MTNKAVIIGINYTGSSLALSGCVNDTRNLLGYLKKEFKTIHLVQLDAHGKETNPIVPNNTSDNAKNDLHNDILQVLLLTDEQNGKHSPTRQNILDSFTWLTADTKAGQCRFLSYSGHGSHTTDLDGDEFDCEDETIVPLDYLTNGMITDDVIRVQLVNAVPEGATLRCLWDCCHSGTMGDLRYGYLDNSDYSNGWVPPRHRSEEQVNNKHPETACDVVMWSGCRDTQTSADALLNGKWAGALTTAFLETLNAGAPTGVTPKLTSRQIFTSLNQIMTAHRFTQKPQVTSGKKLDLDKPFSFFPLRT